MRLLNDLVSWKSNNLYARLRNSKSGKYMSYRLTLQARTKFLIIPAVIVSGILGACFTVVNGEEIKADDFFMEEEEVNVYRSPFALPTGVRFVKKTEAVSDFSGYTEWKEGVVASSVSAIFQSGNIVRANINGIWVKEGDWVGEEQVVAIETENVVLIGGEEKEKRNLPLRGVEAELKVIERVN